MLTPSFSDPLLPLVGSPPVTETPLLRQPQRCLFVTSEMADFVKAGGLGDVSAALPRALQGACDVRVLVPGYPAVLNKAQELVVVGTVPARAALPESRLGLLAMPDGLLVYVLLCPELFERNGSPYVSELGQEWEDNARRFATLSHAAAAIGAGKAGLNWRPDVLHLNDWPGALAASYLRWDHEPVPCLITVHNLAYQGLFPASMAPLLGIPEKGLEDMEFYGQLSFLKAGLTHAAHINTVSVHYAQQITQPTLGCGLDGLLAQRAREGRLTGIVNGIDGSWDPTQDPHLASPFSLSNWTGRQANAQRVRQFFGLPTQPGPLFSVVSRLVHQKGLDLICQVAPQLVAAGGQLVIIGGGEPHIERQVQALTRAYPQHVGAFIGFEEGLARQMFAGSDFLLMPSRFEPCGLSQMYAQRFGSLPIAHATGGLVDTVDDGVTGFLFGDASADALRRCLMRALRTFQMPGLFHAMRRAAMLRPSGWQTSGQQYLSLYQHADMLAK